MDDQVLVIVCGFLGILVIANLFLFSAIRIVPENKRMVIFRYGRYLGVRGPGLVAVFPGIDRAIKVDLREREGTFFCQDIPTRDDEMVTFETYWQYKIPDPTAVELQAGNFDKIAQEQLVSSLKKVIGSLRLRQVLTEGEAIAEQARSQMNATGQTWGGWAMKIELRHISSPSAAQDAGQRGRMRQAALLGSVGEAKSPVYTQGTIEMNGEIWNAASPRPIAPGKKVRVSRVVLEVEEL